MKTRRTRGFWLKKRETFKDGSQAKSRAGHLRTDKHIQHVTVDKADGVYSVRYSVAKWYFEECQRLGISI